MINADQKQIHADFIYSDLTYIVRGCFFSVFNELGFGHKENVYHKALKKEFENLLIPFQSEKGLPVTYKGEIVGSHRPDFLIDHKLIIELKAVEYIQRQYEYQLLHYLKTTGYNLGLLVNFGSPKLYIKRFVRTKS